jgi:REP element-mobilizing transposase RayT
MGRKLRYLPEGGALVEVTCRTLQGRLLLRPDPELNDIAAGILGRSQRLYPVDIVGYVVASNHFHILVWAEDAQRLARFVGYFNSNLAREVSRKTGWTGKIWDRRYQAIVISNEEEAQAGRLRYILSQGYESYCTSFRSDSSTEEESSWYMKTSLATEWVRTRPWLTHW